MADGDYYVNGIKVRADGAVYTTTTANMALLAASSGSSLVGEIYDAPSAVALNLHAYIEDDGFYNVMGFVPQNLKSAIRAYTSSTDVSTYAQAAISAGMTAGKGVRFPRGRYVAPGLVISAYLGNSFVIDGIGAVIRLGANEGGIHIHSASENVEIRGLKFDSTAASGASQFGVKVTDSARIDLVGVKCNLLTTGIDWVSTHSSGGVPIPSRAALCDLKACGNGFLARTTGEYVDLLLNRITDCTTTGALIQAGNCKQIGNIINQNAIGLEIDGSVAGNADHGQASGNTLNHNLKCGLYIHDLVYSMNATGNQVWSTVTTNFSGVAGYTTSFGVILKSVKNVNLSGSTLAYNKVNLGVDVVTKSVLSGITFIADSSNTIFNIREITALAVANGNRIGGNTFEGSLSGAANNNDTEQIYVIGAAGAPAFANSWANLGGGYSTAAYHKDATGVVHLRGVVASGTINTTIFTLPATFRPATNYIWNAISNDAIARVEVGTSGTVTAKNGSNVWVSLDGLSFLAEA